MLEALVTLLIWGCLLALVIYVVLLVLREVGVLVPPKVQKIIWVIVALLILLLVVRMLTGGGLAIWPGRL